MTENDPVAFGVLYPDDAVRSGYFTDDERKAAAWCDAGAAVTALYAKPQTGFTADDRYEMWRIANWLTVFGKMDLAAKVFAFADRITADKNAIASGIIQENKRLKEAIRRLADQDATLSVCEGNVIVEMDTLTDEEREAIESVATLAGLEASAPYNEKNEEEKKFWRDRKNILRSLLDRLKVRS